MSYIRLLAYGMYCLLLSAQLKDPTPETDGFVQSRIELVATADFSMKHFLKIAGGESDAPIVRWYVTDPAGRSCIEGSIATEESFEERMEEISKCSHRFPVARVIRLRTGTSLQIRFRDGRLFRQHWGEDPLQIKIRGLNTLQAYHIIPGAPGAGTFESRHNQGPTYSFYLHTPRPLRPIVGQWPVLWKELSERVSGGVASVVIRRDSFFKGTGVPFVFPFETAISKTGTLGEVPYRDEIWCILGEKVKCGGLVDGVLLDTSEFVAPNQRR